MIQIQIFSDLVLATRQQHYHWEKPARRFDWLLVLQAQAQPQVLE